MDRFYRQLLEEGMSPSKALREAQIWICENPGAASIADRGETVIRKVAPRTTPRQRSPYQWGGFIVSGMTE